MKLHLPKLLRNAVLACITAVAGVSTTVGTAALTGGVVTIVLSSQQAQAGWAADGRTGGYIYYYDQSDNPGIVTAPLSDPSGRYGGAADALENFRLVSGNADKTNTFDVLQAKNGSSFSVVQNPWQTDGTYSHLSIQKLIFGSAVSGSDEYDGTGKGAFRNKQAESTISIAAVSGTLSAVENDGTLTLGSSNGTLKIAGTMTNTGTMTVKGAITIDDVSGFTAKSASTETWSDATNSQGYQTLTGGVYVLSTGGVTYTDATQVNVGGVMQNLTTSDDGETTFICGTVTGSVYYITNADHVAGQNGTDTNTVYAVSNGRKLTVSTQGSSIAQADLSGASSIDVTQTGVTLNNISLAEGSCINVLTSSVSISDVVMDATSQINIACGTETTVADVFGDATWNGGTFCVNNGTTLDLSGSVFNTVNLVVDGTGSMIRVDAEEAGPGKVYLQGDVTLKNGAVLEFVENAGNDGFNYGNDNRIEILSNAEMRVNNNRLSLQENDRIVLNNGKITGTGDNLGALHFFETGSIVQSDGTSIIEAPIALYHRGKTTTFQVDSGTLTVSSFTNHSGNLIKTGTGTLKVTGGINYTGTTEVTGGELLIAAASNSGKGVITVGADGTLTIAESANQTIGTTISGAGTLNLNGSISINKAGFAALSGEDLSYSDGANGYIDGMLIATMGSVNVGTNGSVIVTDGETTTTYTSSDITIKGGNILVGPSDGTYFINTDVTYDATKMGEATQFNMAPGAIFRSDDASVMGKTKAADTTATIYLDKEGTISSGNYSLFNGNVVITSGTTVQASGHSHALGQDYRSNKERTVTLESGATFDLNGQDTYYHFILQSGATLTNTGSQKTPDQNMQPPAIDLVGDATVNAASDFGMRYANGQEASETLNLGGHTLTKTGAGTFFLYATAVSAGTIDVKEGTLRSVNASGIAAVDLKIQSGATQSFDAREAATGRSWRTLTAYSGASTGAVTLEQGANLTLTIENGTNAGVLINKTGEGTLKLNGSTTLTGGITVAAGTLTLNGATTLGGTITIEEGATLNVSNGVAITISSLAGFQETSSTGVLPTTNSLVSGSIYKIVDNKNASNANNNLTSVIYNGRECQVDANGNIPASTKIYYAVEAGDDKVVTVGGDSATADTANATEFYVGKNGTLKIAGNASDSLTANQVLATTVGDGIIVLASTVGVATGTSIQFAGKLSIATGGELNFNPGKGAAADMTQVTAVEFDGGTVNYNAAPDVWNSVSVTTNGGTMNIQDHPDRNTTPIQFTGVTSLTGDLTINTRWKSYLNIEKLTGAGDLILSSTGGNTDSAGANTVIGVKDGFAGDIDIRGKAANIQHVTVDVASGYTLAASRIIINDAAGVDVKLSGSGTYTNGDSLALAEGISLADGWNGTVAVTGANVTSTVDASSLTNSASKLALNGLTVADGAALTLGGNVSLGGTVSLAESIAANGTLTLGKDLKLSVAESMIADGSGSGVKVITLITGAGASAVGSMTTAMLSDDLLALGVEDSWVFNADGTISFTSANTAPKLVWGGGDGNLSDSSKYADGATYKPGQDITFGAVTDGNADTITVAASDSIANATVQTGGNYVFTGTKLNVTGTLSIASGATVDAQSGLTIGTSLESTGTLKTTTIDGTGKVNITGGSLELSGSNALANTGTKSISSAELKGSWTATGVSLGTGVTVGEGGTITLTDTTMAGTVTNKGNLTLTGTVNITPSASFQTQESGVQYSDGANGLKFADVTYTIATGSGTTTASDVTWKLDGTATTTATYSEGKLNVKGAQQGTLYWANSGTVTYGTGGLAGATGIALNGGNVELNTSLDAQSMTDGIQANAAGTVSLGSSATLASTQVNGASETNKVTLAGSGTYALGESTALNTGVVLGSDWQGTVQSTVSSITSDTTLALGNKVDFSAATLTLGGILTAGDSTALTMKALSFSSVGDSEGVARLTGSSLTLTSIAVTNDALSGLTTGTWTLVDVDTLTGVTAIKEIVGAGVDNLYKYTFTVENGVVTMKGEVNGLVWGSNDADFGADAEQSWDSSTTTSDTNVVFNGQCSSTDDTSAGTVNVDSNGVVVKDVTITQDSTLADAQDSYTLTGGDIEAKGSLTVLEDTSLTVENNSTFEKGVEVENGSLTVGKTGSLTVGTDTVAANMKVDATNGSLTVSAGALVTVYGKLSVDTIEVAELDSTKDVMISANEIAAATGGGKITIDLVDDILASVTTGTYSLIKYATGAEIVLNSADEQAILKKGYWVTMGETSTFALRNSTTTYGMNVSDKDVTWNVGDTAADNRLTVLNQNGMLLSADMLNEVDIVKVKGSKSIDLTTSGANFDGEVKLNKLTADGTGAALAIKGDGATKDTVSITSADGGYTGSVKLNGVTAQLGTTAAPVKGATVVVEGDTVVLNGALEDGTLVVDQGAALTGNALTVKNSTVGINIGAAGNVLANSVVEKIMKDGLAKIEGITTDDTDKLAVGSYSDAAGFQASTAYDKYFTNMTVEDNVVRVTRNTNFYSSKIGGLTKNGKAGLTLADAVLLKLNPQGAETATLAAGSRAAAPAPAPASGLAKVLDQLDVLVASGNIAAADELGAALAGASTAVLGSAVSSDVERQLKAIRNRTTTMGVDQGVIHHDMPYFNAWINAEGDHRELADNGTESGYKVNSWGGTVGFDVDIAPTFTAGMALTAMYGDLDATGADKASGDVDTYYVSAFARYCASAWTHTFVATAGLADVSLNRTLMGEETKGETDGMSFGLMYEVGRVFALNEDSTACLQPVFNVTWRHTQLDGYTEKGSDLALNVDKQTMDTITFGMGARLQAVVGESMYNRTSIFECRLLAKADVGDRQGSSEVTLAGTSVEVDATEQGAIGLEAGAGLTIPLGDAGASLFMDASVELRADYTKVNGTVGYRVNF